MSERCTSKPSTWFRHRCERPAGHSGDHACDDRVWAVETEHPRDRCRARNKQQRCSNRLNGISPFQHSCGTEHVFDAVGSYEQDEDERTAGLIAEFDQWLERWQPTPYEATLFREAYARISTTLATQMDSYRALRAALQDAARVVLMWNGRDWPERYNNERLGATEHMRKLVHEANIAEATAVNAKRTR